MSLLAVVGLIVIVFLGAVAVSVTVHTAILNC